jgi:hypothetical protein
MDAQRRQALHKEMEASAWTLDTVSSLFYLLSDASDGLVSANDIALADSALVAQLTGNSGTYPNKAQHIVSLTELITKTRCTAFLLDGAPPSLLAYVREWKHWIVCCCGGSVGREKCEPGALHLIAQLAHLNIVPTFNQGIQFFCGIDGGGCGTAVDCVFHLYVLMKSIGHFDYRDDFATHMAHELVLLEADTKNRTDFVRHLRSIASS